MIACIEGEQTGNIPNYLLRIRLSLLDLRGKVDLKAEAPRRGTTGEEGASCKKAAVT